MHPLWTSEAGRERVLRIRVAYNTQVVVGNMDIGMHCAVVVSVREISFCCVAESARYEKWRNGPIVTCASLEYCGCSEKYMELV